jgi:hypothetical protein
VREDERRSNGDKDTHLHGGHAKSRVEQREKMSQNERRQRHAHSLAHAREVGRVECESGPGGPWREGSSDVVRTKTDTEKAARKLQLSETGGAHREESGGRTRARESGAQETQGNGEKGRSRGHGSRRSHT